eukprot:3421011-Pyramimonas_sp.AAC.1
MTTGVTSVGSYSHRGDKPWSRQSTVAKKVDFHPDEQKSTYSCGGAAKVDVQFRNPSESPTAGTSGSATVGGGVAKHLAWQGVVHLRCMLAIGTRREPMVWIHDRGACHGHVKLQRLIGSGPASPSIHGRRVCPVSRSKHGRESCM